MQLNESIRSLRRERGMTQEQLAEAMNVSAAAVSKWENGQSVPDIAVLTALADYFEVSLDALVGYMVQTRRREDMVEQIRHLTRHKQYAEALQEADEALKRYPNHFIVVHEAARVYGLCGVEQRRENALRRALTLTERAMALIGQNTDPSIRVENLWTSMGLYHANLGESEQAIRCYEAGNVAGMNDVAIAIRRAALGQYEEALPMLSRGLINSMVRLFNAGSGAMRCLAALGELKEAEELSVWLLQVLEGMDAVEGSYVEKMKTIAHVRSAAVCLRAGRESKALEHLSRALEAARRFDAAPDYSFAGIRFYRGEEKVLSDSVGETAMAALHRSIEQSDEVSGELARQLKEIENSEEK